VNGCTIEAMDFAAAGEILKQILASTKRTVTEAQKDLVISVFKSTPTPLYLQAASIFAQGWNSYTPIEQCTLEQGMRGIINQVNFLFFSLYDIINQVNFLFFPPLLFVVLAVSCKQEFIPLIFLSLL
jgi:hypothetical protein